MTHIEQIQTHSIYLTTLPSCLENLSLIENDEEVLHSLSEYGIQCLNRIKAVLVQLQIRIDSVDPYLFRLSTLEQLNKDVNQINTYLQSGGTNLVSDYTLNSINTLLDNIISNINQIPQIFNKDEFDGIRENVTSFRRSVARHKVVLEEIQEEIVKKSDEVASKIEELNNSFNQLNEKFSTKYQQFEGEFLELHNKLQEKEEERDNNFNQTLNDFQEIFDKSMVEIKKQWEQEYETLREETLKKQQEYNEILEDHKKSVESLVGIISTNSISGHFKEVADKKYKLITIWQWLTGVGFAVTIGFGIYAFIFNKDLDWPSLIARFIVTTALGSFTAYSARQVTKNETEEKYNRQMEVELKTLNPYIASFSEDDQIKLKEQLFPQIFGRAEVNSSALDRGLGIPNNTPNSQDITNVNNIIEILKNITGSQTK